jgi:hypothetical protein
MNRQMGARVNTTKTDRELQDSELASVSGGLVVPSIISEPRFWTILHSLYARARAGLTA